MLEAGASGADNHVPGGSDHVVTACQAVPFQGASNFFKPNMSPADVLQALKDAKALNPKVDGAQAYIVHVTEWVDASPPPSSGTSTPLGQALKRSEWAGFIYDKKAKPVKIDSNGNPILFNKTSTALVGVTYFSRSMAPSAVTVAYTMSTTPAPKQNVTDLTALLNALAGTSGSNAGKAAAATFNDTYLASCPIPQDTDLPLSINLGYAVTPIAPPPAAAPATATQGVTVSPASVDFGTTAVSTPTGTQKVTVTNKGPGKMTFDTTTAGGTGHPGVTISGTNAGDFSIAGTTCTATVGAGATCDLNVIFSPTAAGARGATLGVSDDAANSPQTVALTGTGAAAGSALGGAKQSKPSPAAAASTPAAAPPSNNQTTQGNSTPSPTGASPTDCTTVTSDAPCSVSRSVVDYDREYWDIGLSLALPGVPEKMYNAALLTAKPSITMHTDVYALVDVYFDGNRNSAVPHLAFGVPAASQPLHRQAYALSFPVTTWLGLSSKVPFTLDVVAGVAAVKEYHVTNDPNMANALTLKTGWTAKRFLGVELPLNQLVSRVSKIGK
jgi:hypothetical protein